MGLFTSTIIRKNGDGGKGSTTLVCNRGRLWAAVEEVSLARGVLVLAVMLNLRKLCDFRTSQEPVR